MASVVSNEMEFLKTAAQWIFPTRYVAVTSDTDLTAVGEVAQPSCPSTTAVVVRRKSFFANKGGRGRIYVAGIPRTIVEESRINPALGGGFAVLANLMDNVLTVLSGTKYQPIIYDRLNPATSPFVETAVYDDILRVQRRREVGVGV
jgi:hypothetical protein